MQGPIVFLNVATNFEYNLIIFHHSLQVNSCRSNHLCRGHLVRCDNHVSVVIVWYCLGAVHCFGFGWGGPVTLTCSELWRVCPHLCWEKVRISGSFVS